MLRIRFSRVGKKNAPSFRLVLTPKQSPPKGKFLEILGFYNPRTKEKGVEKERVLHWKKQGAQPSDTSHNFLIKEGVIEGKKLSVHSTKKRKQEEAKEDEAKPEKPEPETDQPTAGEGNADQPSAEAEGGTTNEEVPTEESATPTEESTSTPEEEASPVSDSPSQDPSGTPSADESTNGIDKE